MVKSAHVHEGTKMGCIVNVSLRKRMLIGYYISMLLNANLYAENDVMESAVTE